MLWLSSIKADVDRWTGFDDGTGKGVARDDIRGHLHFLVEKEQGRKLPPITADIAQAQAQKLVETLTDWSTACILLMTLENYTFFLYL
ncbi:hypothetical protein TrVFT333_008430 [Trichoderma virens FT-333]|nr:hypothetical protein TrVFT333_008430 [Trichoderma virens FT-333]